jgi:hypothetical protein
MTQVSSSYFEQAALLPKFLRWLGGIVAAKSEYEASPPPSFAEIVYDYYLAQHSQRDR